MIKHIITMLLAGLLLTGCAALLPYLVAAGQVAQWVTAIIDQVEPVKEAYFDAAPAPDVEMRIDQAIAATRTAIAALDEAVLVAQSSHDADVEAAKAHLLKCYEHLYQLLESAGLLGSTGELGAAPGITVRVPSPEQVGARLR